jgi:hypothetical protein
MSLVGIRDGSSGSRRPVDVRVAPKAPEGQTPPLAQQTGAHRDDRPYRAGRAADWIKVKNRRQLAMSRVMEGCVSINPFA